ncbi:hypothetical protein ACFSHQ_14915 [Gemmobacter lanyuensis]
MTPTPCMDFGPRPQRKDRPKMFRFLPLLTASLIALSAPVLAQQNLFAPRIIINDRAVTEFEYQQRLRFLQLLRAPGDVEKAALEGLIDDRLRQQEAKRFDVKLNEDDLKKGMEEFAARANLSAEEFIKALGKPGSNPKPSAISSVLVCCGARSCAASIPPMPRSAKRKSTARLRPKRARRP